MIRKKRLCPRCASETVYRIHAHREPLSLTYFALLGTYLWLILPALPSKFRCAACEHTFRRYTRLGWLYLALLILLFFSPFILLTIFQAIHPQS